MTSDWARDDKGRPSANPLRVESLDVYLERLASDDAVPGGGSAAAVTAALGAALIAMVARIARRNPRNEAHAPALEAIVARADELRILLSVARRSDEAAFANVVAAQALHKGTEREKAHRRTLLDESLEQAAEAPLAAAALSVDVLELAPALLAFTPNALRSDVGCAAEFASAAIAACAYNVRVNHRYMHDVSAIQRQEERMSAYEIKGRTLLERSRAAAAQDVER